MENLESVKRDFLNLLGTCKDAKALDALQTQFLGKKGIVTQMLKETDFSTLSVEERKTFGQDFNATREFIKEKIDAKAAEMEKRSVQTVNIDLTMPGINNTVGSIHPINLVQMELEEIFQRMGFMVLEGYEVETEYYNFDALNIPFDHPARETQDTYWLTNGLLMRTQTSANQVRMLEKYGAPMRAIFPGRCFRYENVDASHENTFYQLEGLMVDKKLSIANLIAIMRALLSEIFHRSVKVRLRPGFFPFVEPGFELDINCLICNGKGCSTCKGSGWVELLPCGLVHPRVLKFGKIDPDQYSGFAFGLGLTRLVMMKYHIPEIRLFNSGEIRFYNQFQAIL